LDRDPLAGAVTTETLSAPKPTQRWRLVQAMIDLSGSAGYHGVSVARLCAAAGVSTQTYYEHFADKEDVLVDAYRVSAERMLARMRSALADGETSEPPRLALSAVLEAVACDPDMGRLLFVEALSGRSLMSEERARTLRRLERRAAEFLELSPKHSPTLDIPVIALVGGLRHIVSRHLNRYAEDELPSRLEDGLAWLYSYARGPGVERWSTSGRAALEGARVRPPPPARAPRPDRLPPGRHGLPAALIVRRQRARLIFATAEVTMAKGYANSTVKDILAQARVAKTVFYEHFTDKRHAFLEAQRYPTQFVLDRCAEAYFSSQKWPARVWHVLDALIGLIVANPAISYLLVVECYSAGPQAIRASDDLTYSFTFFLEEGYGYRDAAGSLPRFCSQAIAGAIFEIVRCHIARGDPAGLAASLPKLTYIAIAPFTGADEAIELVEEMAANPP
jgi:AcrR family transcriptional regulator